MLNKIEAIISEYVDLTGKTVAEGSNLRYDLGLNSLDLINMAVDLEKEFGIKIDDSQVTKLKTVSELIDLLNSEIALVAKNNKL